jgi:hypothetical protein
MNKEISITELEAAINYWRQTSPSVGEELRLSTQAAALASPYAMLIMTKRESLNVELFEPVAQQAIMHWLERTDQSR